MQILRLAKIEITLVDCLIWSDNLEVLTEFEI